MHVLITGINGFVGGHLTERLLDRGDTAVGLSAVPEWPEPLAHLRPRASILAGDLTGLTDDAFTELIAQANPDAIIHLAAQANPQASRTNPRHTWDVNLLGTLALLEAVRRAELRPRIVLISTGVCYGNPAPEDMPVSERCPLKPLDPYSASKAAADVLGIQHHLEHGTDVVMVRPFNHAGPRQESRYVISGLARQVAEVEAGLREVVEVGNLEVERDFTDVRDVVAAYTALATPGSTPGGEIYNLGSGRATKLADALDYLKSIARVPVEHRVDPTRVRSGDLLRLVADSSKLRAATGWTPQFSIEQTLSDTLDHWRRVLAQ